MLSGNRPRCLVAADPERLCVIDGRLPDLDSDPSPKLVPLVSDAWGNHFDWKGFGEMPDDERDALATFVARAHAQGRRIRFWGGPDTRDAWRTQRELGVDLVNTDRPAELARCLREPMPVSEDR